MSLKTNNHKLLLGFFILSLLLIKFFLIHQIHFTTPDDISTAMRSAISSSLIDNIILNSVESGRVWVGIQSVFSSLILNMQISGFVVAVLDILSTVILFLSAWYFFGLTSAFLSLLLFISSSVIGWWYNIYVSYPGFYFSFSLVFLFATIYDLYLKKNSVSFFLISFLLFFYTIVNYELFSLLSIFLFILISTNNYKNFKHTNLKDFLKKIAPYIILLFVYFVLYFLWKITMNKSYDGTTISLISINKFIIFLKKVLLSGSVIDYFFNNYSLNIYHAYNSSNVQVAIKNITWSNKSIAGFVILSLSLFFFLINFKLEEVKIKKQAFVSFILTLVILTPFVFSKKYQQWFLYEGVMGYTFSIPLQATISLGVSSLFIWIINKTHLPKLRYFLKGLLSLFIAFLFTQNFIISSQNIKNIAQDNARWKAVDLIFESDFIKNKLLKSSYVYSPSLWDHNWWLGFHSKLENYNGNFNSDYWKIYTNIKFQEIKFNKLPSGGKIIDVFNYSKNKKVIWAYSADLENKTIKDLLITYKMNNKLDNFNLSIYKNFKICNNKVCELSVNGPINKDQFIQILNYFDKSVVSII